MMDGYEAQLNFLNELNDDLCDCSCYLAMARDMIKKYTDVDCAQIETLIDCINSAEIDSCAIGLNVSEEIRKIEEVIGD